LRPQQPTTLFVFIVFNLWGIEASANPFAEARPAGKSEPQNNPFAPVSAQRECKWDRNPEAQTVKAVEQFTKETGANSASKAYQYISGAILDGKQMGYPPDTENGDREPQKIQFQFRLTRR
jgi:hypothetical protein